MVSVASKKSTSFQRRPFNSQPLIVVFNASTAAHLATSQSGFVRAVIGGINGRASFGSGFIGVLFIHKLPSTTPNTIILMEFNGHDHVGAAIIAIPPIFICSIQKDLEKQLQDCR